MEYKELVKHYTHLIKDDRENKWKVVEASDLEEICEAYHRYKLKPVLLAFLEFYHDPRYDTENKTFDEDIDMFFANY